jgi:hypothetical protein
MSNYPQLKQRSLKMSLKKPYLLSTLMLLASPIQAGDLNPASDPQSTSSGIHQVQTGTDGRPLCITPATLNASKRWCNKGNGTVMDMTTGLIWLQTANWSGKNHWNGNDDDNAVTQAGILSANMADVTLSDGSVLGDWRLPTKTELVGITIGTEPVSSSNPRVFLGVELLYWTFTSLEENTIYAWYVNLRDGQANIMDKATDCGYVWPVRGGHHKY